MQRGSSRKLMAGIPRINEDMSVTVVGSTGQAIHHLPAAALVGGGFGYVYERLVGLWYEAQGYRVEYRSHLGYLDGGVDLVADDPDNRHFVQCKLTFKPISPAKVEQLLHKASLLVSQNLLAKSCHFDLVVPSIAMAFPERAGGAANRAHQAFLHHNRVQRSVKLAVVEVPVHCSSPRSSSA